MRKKIEDARKHVSKGVSFQPDRLKRGMKRAIDLDLSFSAYLSALMDLDLKKNLIKKP